MTSMFKAQRSTLLLAAAGAAVGAIVMRTMPRTRRTVDAGHPDRSLSDGLGDERSTLGLPKSHRPPGLFLRSAYVFVCGGVLAVGIRVFYGMVSNVSDGPDWHPAVRTIWHSEHRLGAGAIMALAGVYLGLAAALFLATAFRASDPRAPAVIEDRMIATQQFASAVAAVGLICFWVIMPDAVASSTPVATVAFCLFTAAVSAVMAVINGPTAIEHERWATSAAERLTQVKQLIAAFRGEGVRLPSGTYPPLRRAVSRLFVTDVDADIYARMIGSVRWVRLLMPTVLGVAVAIIAWAFNNVAVGLYVGAAAMTAQAIALVMALSGAQTLKIVEARDGSRRARVVLAPILVCGPGLLAMLLQVNAVNHVTTMTGLVVVGASMLVPFGLTWWSFRIITRNPTWILGGLMLLEGHAGRERVRNAQLAVHSRAAEPTI